jgi:DNA-binding transcriptional MerR regulator
MSNRPDITDTGLSDKMVAQGELLRMARAEGLPIKGRTLRFWATKGLIPYPSRIAGNGMRGYYPLSMLTRLRRICSLRKRSLNEIKLIIEKEPIPCTMRFIDDTGRPHEYTVLYTMSMEKIGDYVEEVRLMEDGSMVVVNRRI